MPLAMPKDFTLNPGLGPLLQSRPPVRELQGGGFSSEFSGNFLVRLEPLWPIRDLLVVTAGFHGSGSSPEMVSIRSET